MATHLLTGAGSGIGAALADSLHARGDSLVLVARSQERADELASRWDGAQTLVADLAVPGPSTTSRCPSRSTPSSTPRARWTSGRSPS